MCDLQELTSIVDTLQQLSARFYGPRCAQTLLTSNTGKAVVTSDGLTILEAVSLSHPMADMVVTSLKKCHTLTYDGSKTFLLYLKFFLKHLNTSVEFGKFSGRGTNTTFTNSSYYRHSKVCAAKAVNNVLLDVLPELYKELHNHNSVRQCSTWNTIEILSSVCQATLLPHFNLRLSKQLASVLTKVVPDGVNIETMREVLQLEVLKFGQLIVKVPGRNYAECTVWEPFLIKKSKSFKNFMQNLTVSKLTGSQLTPTQSTSSKFSECQATGSQFKQTQSTSLELMDSQSTQPTHTQSVSSKPTGSQSEGLPSTGSPNSNSTLSHYTGSQIKAISIQMSSEDTEDENSDIGMIVNDKDQVHGSLLARRQVVEIFAEECVQLNINLIICSDSLPPYAIDVLHRHRLSVLTNVLKEDIDMLELFTHTTSVGSLVEKINGINIISLNSVEEISIGNEQFLHLKADAFECKTCSFPKEARVCNGPSPTDAFSFMHVAVCAPSPGLCDQTALLLQKALNAMYLSLEGEHEMDGTSVGNSEITVDENGMNTCHVGNGDASFSSKNHTVINDKSGIGGIMNRNSEVDIEKDSDLEMNFVAAALSSVPMVSFKVVPAGGAFELIMSKLLKDKSRTINDPHVKEICLVLSEALIEVVKTLHDNLSTGRQQSKSRFIHIKTEMFDRLGAGELVGLNSKGEVLEKGDKILLEPLRTKIHVLGSVLSLLMQMLRIDNVIPTKKKRSNEDTDDT